MKIRVCRIHAFQLPLHAGGKRKGFIIELQNEQGKVAYGEVSPLPGRSKETHQEALFALFKLQDQFIHGNLAPFALPPSVSFGMESALIALQSPLQKPISLRYTALSYGKYIDTPCSQVKVKVSGLSFAETISLVKTFLKKGKRLILDFNTTWTKEDILALRREFSPTDFDGLEDPTNSADDLDELYEQTGFSFHIDELPFTPFKGVQTVVIKPTLIGNSAVIKKIQGYPIRLSSSMETAVGLMHIMRMASLLQISTPLGIDTLNAFEEHLIPDPFKREGEYLILDPEIYNNMPIDKTKLISCHPSST